MKLSMQNGRLDWLHYVVMLLALGGLFPNVFFEVSHLVRKPMPPRIDRRYSSIQRALPASERLVRYVSDQDIRFPVGSKLFAHARYALSPHLLVPNGNTRYVIVNLLNPLQMDDVCREQDLVPIVVSEPGVALATTKKTK
jgi:hypothetical protein